MSLSARTRHYGTFYDLPPAERNDPHTGSDARPLLLIWGNCQAEALRVVVAEAPGFGFRTVRIPPVFELTSADLPPVWRLCRMAAAVVSQPIRTGYRSLPLGTQDLRAALPADCRMITVPVVRSAVLRPFQVLARHPDGLPIEPPVVPYQDLRTVASAATGRDLFDVQPDPEVLLAAGQASLGPLRSREERCDVIISDLLADPGDDDMFTINHPRNAVLIELSRRIQTALDQPVTAGDPGRNLLSEVQSPMDRRTALARGVDPSAESGWRVNGTVHSARQLHEAHLAWYADQPEMLAEAVRRHADTLDLLGLR